MTVGELRKKLEGVPDDVIVVVFAGTGTLPEGCGADVDECVETEKNELRIII